MSAVFKREFKSYFKSPLGYVVITVFALFEGFYFYFLFANQYGDMATLFSYLLTIIMFICPIITMRLMSEDKRLKIDQSLLTAPVSLWGIVMGKYLAALAVYSLCFSLTLVNQLIFAMFVTPDWIVYIGNLVGMLLLGGALIAMGLFISSLTESQMVSAVSSFGAVMFVMLIDTIAGAVNLDLVEDIVTKYLSFYTRYENFSKGILDFSDLLFFVSFAFLFLFLSVRTLEKKRWA